MDDEVRRQREPVEAFFRFSALLEGGLEKVSSRSLELPLLPLVWRELPMVRTLRTSMPMIGAELVGDVGSFAKSHSSDAEFLSRCETRKTANRSRIGEVA